MDQDKDITKKWKWKQISEKEKYAIEALPRARRIFGYKPLTIFTTRLNVTANIILGN